MSVVKHPLVQVTVHNARELALKGRNEYSVKSQVHAIVRLGDKKVKSMPVPKQRFPKWEHTAEFFLEGSDSKVEIDIVQKGKLGKRKLSHVSISTSNILEKNLPTVSEWHQLESRSGRKKSKKAGELFVTLSLLSMPDDYSCGSALSCDWGLGLKRNDKSARPSGSSSSLKPKRSNNKPAYSVSSMRNNLGFKSKQTSSALPLENKAATRETFDYNETFELCSAVFKGVIIRRYPKFLY